MTNQDVLKQLLRQAELYRRDNDVVPQELIHKILDQCHEMGLDIYGKDQ
jgi:hypothetical protein